MRLDLISNLQSFFQLNFLFSGLEVSSTFLMIARLTVFIIFSVGLAWLIFKILIKSLDCIQSLFQSIGSVPKYFFLLLFLALPLSSESVGAQWIGYLIIILILMLSTAAIAFILVLWKYGVDQAVRFLNYLRLRSEVNTPNHPLREDPA